MGKLVNIKEYKRRSVVHGTSEDEVHGIIGCEFTSVVPIVLRDGRAYLCPSVILENGFAVEGSSSYSKKIQSKFFYVSDLSDLLDTEGIRFKESENFDEFFHEDYNANEFVPDGIYAVVETSYYPNGQRSNRPLSLLILIEEANYDINGSNVSCIITDTVYNKITQLLDPSYTHLINNHIYQLCW